MNQYQFTPQAVTDLFDIWNFIAADNPAAADSLRKSSFGHVLSLQIRLMPDERELT